MNRSAHQPREGGAAPTRTLQITGRVTQGDTKKRQEFLDTLRGTGNVRLAASNADVARQVAYRARDSSATFRADWDEALEEARELLEAEARRRAAIGVDEPVFYKGKVVGHIRKYSDNLLMFLLKAHWPEKFRENHAVEHSGPGGGPVKMEAKTQHVFQPSKEVWDDILRVRAEVEKLRDGDTDEDTVSESL